MSEKDYKNPFAALFPCAEEGDAFKTNVIPSDIIDRPNKSSECSSQESSNIEMQSTETKTPSTNDTDRHSVTHFLEDVFRITLSKEPCCNIIGPTSLVFLNEVHVALRYQTDLDETCIDRAVFERLLLGDPTQHIVHRRNLDEDDDKIACEKRVIFYLYQSYHRFKQHTKIKMGPLATAHHVILNQTASALCNPEMFPEAKLAEDFMKLLLHYHDQTGHCEVLCEFLNDVAAAVKDIECADLASVFQGSFNYLKEKFMKTSVSDRNLFQYIDILNYFMGSENLVKAFLKNSMPNEPKSGKAYQNSLLGLPLSVSCLPRSEGEPFEFFQDSSRYPASYHEATQERLSVPLSTIARHMHKVFDKMLRKSLETREMLLQWIGNCLDANSGREKIGNSEQLEIFSSLHASDGFFLNFTAVLLLLCKPFAIPCSPKLLKVDPLYVGAPVSTESNKNGVHIKSLASETCLLPRDEPMAIDQNIKFNFLTECFFATHYALRLGFHVIHKKMGKLNQDIVRFQRVYENARGQGIESSELMQRIKENMEKGVSKFLTYRTALIVPETLDLMLRFYLASATWLVSNCTDSGSDIFKTSKYPSINETSSKLSHIPEFVMENIIDCCIVVKRFSSKSFEMVGSDLDYFMTLIVMFMGSRERVMNPHLRARLAEMMECLLPASDDEPSTLISSIFREKLFTSHIFVQELIPTLLNVFVSIEITGQSVQFDQKFQYRHPMTIVLDYLWKFDIHKQKMKELADDAEKNIEAAQPPLFLHFINLLINDAIYLLDEALSCMSSLREIQLARDSGSWTSLSFEQQQQQEGEFQHMGSLAKFHNVMSNVTIHTLQWLTTEIKSIFCHPSIVERITAMLNYFLLHLVGPQKKNFKVKDLKEYEFKPQELVRDICLIYQNLGAGNDSYAEMFCAGVSRDGRSYNRDLFPLAQSVLIKIGHGVLASELEVIANKVHELAVKQQFDDEMSSGAPEEFFDPIMNTIMKEPVKLPSSGVTVDRSTIVRHLLSDQTDPFNRSPLTMDMVVPDEEMKTKIENWFQERNRE